MPQAQQPTKQEIDDLKAKCEGLKQALETAGGGPSFASGPLDAASVVAAIGDGTIWQLLLKYGPQIMAIIIEILERFQPRT